MDSIYDSFSYGDIEDKTNYCNYKIDFVLHSLDEYDNGKFNTVLSFLDKFIDYKDICNIRCLSKSENYNTLKYIYSYFSLTYNYLHTDVDIYLSKKHKLTIKFTELLFRLFIDYLKYIKKVESGTEIVRDDYYYLSDIIKDDAYYVDLIGYFKRITLFNRKYSWLEESQKIKVENLNHFILRNLNPIICDKCTYQYHEQDRCRCYSYNRLVIYSIVNRIYYRQYRVSSIKKLPNLSNLIKPIKIVKHVNSKLESIDFNIVKNILSYCGFTSSIFLASCNQLLYRDIISIVVEIPSIKEKNNCLSLLGIKFNNIHTNLRYIYENYHSFKVFDNHDTKSDNLMGDVKINRKSKENKIYELKSYYNCQGITLKGNRCNIKLKYDGFKKSYCKKHYCQTERLIKPPLFTFNK